MRAAEWSDKAPIKDKQHILFIPEMGQTDEVAVVILEGKFRGVFVQFYLRHGLLLILVILYRLITDICQ